MLVVVGGRRRGRIGFWWRIIVSMLMMSECGDLVDRKGKGWEEKGRNKDSIWLMEFVLVEDV